jgi:transposase
VLVHPDGRPRRTWAFVTTLCHSRHQYVEFVWDQTVATWLGCHWRAFEWFAAGPERVIVDNAKCAIIKACRHDPLVQRAYAECAEGYGFRIEACLEQGVKVIVGEHVTVQIAKRSELHTFKVPLKRWVVERSFAWLEKNRRLWKNCERLINTSLQMIHLAFLVLMLRRL